MAVYSNARARVRLKDYFGLEKLLIFVAGTLAILMVVGLLLPAKPDVLYRHPLDNMAVVDGPSQCFGAPQEDRGIEYRKFLAASLKIRVRGSSGSGTICDYDPETNTAWVISCGHLWGGNMSAEEGKRMQIKAEVVTWYHNMKKLDEPRSYPADVILYSNSNGYDMSLLKFKPDWAPDYFPIAPADYPIAVGQHFHSTGCDGGREVARYDVEIERVGGSPGNDTIIVKNSPRPDRSGGGLLSDDGYFIAICWGTTDTTSGGGQGLFTSLPTIRNHLASQGYGWLLNKAPPLAARDIPIIDRNDPSRKFPRDYIPLPLAL